MLDWEEDGCGGFDFCSVTVAVADSPCLDFFSASTDAKRIFLAAISSFFAILCKQHCNVSMHFHTYFAARICSFLFFS